MNLFFWNFYCFRILLKLFTIIILLASFTSCEQQIKENSNFISDVKVKFNGNVFHDGKTFIDNRNGIILVHVAKKNGNVLPEEGFIEFDLDESVDILYIENKLYQPQNNRNNIIKFSDLNEMFKGNIPNKISFTLKKKTSEISEKREYILTFSTMPVLELESDSIQGYPQVNHNLLTIYNGVEKKIIPASINIRGIGTRTLDKNSFSLYIDQNSAVDFQNIFEIPSASGTYILYSSGFDPSLMRDKMGHEIFNEQLLDDEVIHTRIKHKFVDLFIGGQYFGVYGLMNIIDPDDLKFETKGNGKDLFSLLEMNAQNIYSTVKRSADILNDVPLYKRGVDSFHVHHLYNKSTKQGGAPFANRNVLCNPNYFKMFDQKYRDAYLATLMLIQGVDNITNNIFLAINKPMNNSDFWDKNKIFSHDFKIYYLPWDMDMSWSLVGWQKIGGYENKDSATLTYIYDALKEPLPYNVKPEDQLSLMTCYTKNIHGYQRNFNDYWKESKKVIFNKTRLQKRMKDIYEELVTNGAYVREAKRWNKAKFSEVDFVKMINWLSFRFDFIEKEFLKLEDEGSSEIAYNFEYNFNTGSFVNSLSFDPLKRSLQIQTKDYVNLANTQPDKLSGSATILELNKKSCATAAVSGGFFEYWFQDKFVHYKDMKLFSMPEAQDEFGQVHDPFTEFNNHMVTKGELTGVFPKEDLVTFPIGLLKSNNKWYSSFEKVSDVIGWNELGEYKFDTIRAQWDILNENGELLFKNIVLNKKRSDSIDQFNSPEFFHSHLQPKIDSSNIVIYLDTYSNRTLTKNDGFEIIVNADNKIYQLSHSGNNEIPKGGYVLSFTKKYKEIYQEKLLKLKIGQTLSYQILFKDSAGKTVDGWEKMTHIRGKVQGLIHNSKILTNTRYGNTRSPYIDSQKRIKNNIQYLDNGFYELKHPRTVLCFKKDVWSLILVEGRNGVSKGMTVAEISNYLLNQNCETAINLDGGSSANMIFDNYKVNESGAWWGKCKGIPRPVSDVLIVN